MRRTAVAAAILLSLLAGCMQPDEEEEDDPLFGLCPQWTQGPGAEEADLHLTAAQPSASDELGPANETLHNSTLDIFRVRVTQMNVSDGRVELRGFAADGRQLMVRDYRRDGNTQMVPVAVLGNDDDGQEFDIVLSAVREGAPGAAMPVRAQWTLEGGEATLRYEVTYHYKVCGAVL